MMLRSLRQLFIRLGVVQRWPEWRRICAARLRKDVPLIGAAVAIVAAYFSWLSWGATERQAIVAEKTLPLAAWAGRLDYLASLPRVVIIPDSPAENAPSEFCFSAKNIGKYPTVGYEVLAFSGPPQPSSHLTTIQPLAGDLVHRHCIAMPADGRVQLLVVSRLAYIVQEGVLPFTNWKMPRGEQYRCEMFGFKLSNTGGRTFVPLDPPHEVRRVVWGSSFASPLGSNVKCSDEYRNL